MDRHSGKVTGILLSAALAGLTTFGTPLAHADTDLGGGCVISADPAATLDALRSRCSPDQQSTIYHDADPGDAPTGATNGWVISPTDMRWWAPLLWIGKNFNADGTVVNRLTPLGIEGWPGLIRRGASLRDGRPTWTIDYAPTPAPQITDEIREVAPRLWFGYSLRQDPGSPAALFTFALT